MTREVTRKTWLLTGVGLGALALVLSATVASRLGLLSVALPDLRPPGPWAWTASRALGATAYLALGLEVLLGLSLSTGAGDRLLARARSVELHQWLSAVALSLTAAHALSLLGDRFVRFDLVDLIVPFASRHRPLAVALGVLSAWAAVVVHASFSLRKSLGPRLWRGLHYLSFAVFASATAHGLTAGSSAGSPWARALYAGAAAAVLALSAARVARAGRARWAAAR